MVKGKADAEEDGKGALVAARDVEPATATGTDVRLLQTELIRQVGATLWIPEHLSEDARLDRIKAAIAMLEGIKPQGEIENLLATQMVASHNTAMECLRRAMVERQPSAVRDLNLKPAAKFLSIYSRQVEVLDKRRGKGQQKMTIEYINVEPGGQAIVGHVETGSARRRKRPATAAMTPAIDHSSEVPVDIPDLVAPQKVPQKTTKKRGA